jgi:hypothetical protein
VRLLVEGPVCEHSSTGLVRSHRGQGATIDSTGQLLAVDEVDDAKPNDGAAGERSRLIHLIFYEFRA